MKFHSLLNLEQFVLEKLSPPGAIGLEAGAGECRALIAQVEKDVKQTFALMSATCISNELQGRHLDLLYKQCRNLSNTLHSYGTGPDLASDLRDEVQIAILDLLEYLQIQYDLFSPSLQVPLLQLRVVATELEARLGQMLPLMKQYHIDQRLQAVIVSKISKLRDKGRATRAQVAHLENIQHHVLKEFKGRFGDYNERFCDFLQRSNFNAEAFLRYRKTKLHEVLEEKAEPEELYSHLCDLEKIFKTTYYKKKVMPYETRLPDVKKVMLEYVRAEMDCLRKKERGLAKAVVVVNPPTTFSAMAPSEETLEKLSLSMSVDVLSYFFRLLISIGVVSNPTKASVLRFLSKNVTTPGAVDRDISLKSLENKFKLVEESTRVATRGILVKMLNQVDEECA